nr:tyrosine-protein kinase family protein [uncultured Pedobacter sp.]
MSLAQTNPPRPSIKQELDYVKFLKIVLSRWYWVLGTLIISLSIAYAYLWYTPKQYSSNIYLKFEKTELGLEKILSTAQNTTNSITSESWVIKSKPVMQRAVNHFDWQVSYFINGKVRVSEMYPERPFIVHLLQQDSVHFYRGPVNFKTTPNGIELNYTLNEIEKKIPTKYNEKISLPGVSFYIEKNNNLANDKLFFFKFNDKSSFAERIAEGIYITEAEKNSNIASITKTDDNPLFARDALNAIAKEYLQQDQLTKTLSSSKVIDFIDEQLAYLSKTVEKSGDNLKEFKQNNKLIELGTTSRLLLEDVKTNETDLKSIQLEMINLQQLEDQINSNQSVVDLNLNFSGNLATLLQTLTSDWNSLQNQRLTLLDTYTKNSTVIKEIDVKLNMIKDAAKHNIADQKKHLNQLKSFKTATLAEYYERLNAFPSQERQLFNLERDYQISNNIFTLLSEKKLESQISKAAILPGASLIDSAQYNPIPISPNSATTWKFAWIIGLASGIGLIFLVRLLNPYIYDKEFVESLTNTPILGLIRHYPGKIEDRSSQLLSIVKPKSLFAESVRSVRTNLSFVAGEKESKVICITSEISGEGKSFVSLNIAASLSLIEKKVILIAADLRKSKIHYNFHIRNKEGLSTYLAGQSKLSDIIHPSGQPNLDILVAGPVPPNPAELMYKTELQVLINELKKTYDFIIFDTAPIGLVSDALPLIRISDINLFVIRTGKSKTSAASIPDRISSEYELNNTFIILNDFVQDHFYSHYYSTKYSDGYYGYYYSSSTYDGAGYYDDEGVKRKWWKRKIGQMKKKVRGRS